MAQLSPQEAKVLGSALSDWADGVTDTSCQHRFIAHLPSQERKM